MPTKEIKELRLTGKLEDALNMAKIEFEAQPDNIWTRRNLSWVYYEYLKKNLAPKKIDSFLNWLTEIKNLNLLEDDKMLFDSCAWQIGIIVFALQKQENVDFKKINEIIEIIKEFHFTKPSEGYSFLYKAFHKNYENWDKYLDFADWWDFENFRSEDYLNEEFNGRQIMSIVERAYIAYAKCLLEGESKVVDDFILPKTVNKEKVKEFMPGLDKLISSHSEYQYPPYFKAKLLLTLGEKDNLLSALLPFAKKRMNDFWVWEVIADAFPSDSEQYLACLCKAVLCKTSDDFLVKVMQKLAEALFNCKLFVEAKYFINRIINARNENAWSMPPQISNWQKQNWFIETDLVKDVTPFLRERAKKADEILFYDMPEEIIVIEHVNNDKKLISFINENKIQGFFNYESKMNRPKIGEILNVRLKQIGNEGFFHLLTVKDSQSQLPQNLVRNFNGNIKFTFSGVAFVDNILIPSYLLDKKDFTSEDLVSGTAIASFNKKRNEWGWKAINIQKITQ